MLNHETNVLFRANNELEQISIRMRRNCQQALEIIRDIELDDLPPGSRERIYGQIHKLREIVRILSPDFEEKVMAKTAMLGRALSGEELRTLLYGLDEY